jgi:hypothetical protein
MSLVDREIELTVFVSIEKRKKFRSARAKNAAAGGRAALESVL